VNVTVSFVSVDPGVGVMIGGAPVPTFIVYDWSVDAQPALNRVQYRTQIVPLCGSPDTVSVCPVPMS
jgi:hypothetical protein